MIDMLGFRPLPKGVIDEDETTCYYIIVISIVLLNQTHAKSSLDMPGSPNVSRYLLGVAGGFSCWDGGMSVVVILAHFLSCESHLWGGGGYRSR